MKLIRTEVGTRRSRKGLPQCSVFSTVMFPWLGRLTPWVGLLTGSVFLVVGITFLTMDTFLNNRTHRLANSTPTLFFLTTIKGLGSYLVVNLFWRFWSSSTWSPWRMSEGVALCRLSMYDLAFDFLKLSLECAILMSLEGRERYNEGILVWIWRFINRDAGNTPVVEWRVFW